MHDPHGAAPSRSGAVTRTPCTASRAQASTVQHVTFPAQAPAPLPVTAAVHTSNGVVVVTDDTGRPHAAYVSLDAVAGFLDQALPGHHLRATLLAEGRAALAEAAARPSGAPVATEAPPVGGWERTWLADLLQDHGEAAPEPRSHVLWL